MIKPAAPQKPDWVSRITYGLGVVFLAIFVIGVTSGVKQIDNNVNEVKNNCVRTELIVLGGRNGTPHWVYDCTGVDLKSLKR